MYNDGEYLELSLFSIDLEMFGEWRGELEIYEGGTAERRPFVQSNTIKVRLRGYVARVGLPRQHESASYQMGAASLQK